MLVKPVEKYFGWFFEVRKLKRCKFDLHAATRFYTKNHRPRYDGWKQVVEELRCGWKRILMNWNVLSLGKICLNNKPGSWYYFKLQYHSFVIPKIYDVQTDVSGRSRIIFSLFYKRKVLRIKKAEVNGRNLEVMCCVSGGWALQTRSISELKGNMWKMNCISLVKK